MRRILNLSGCEKAVSTVQHDNVAFRFATYLHVKGVAKQEAVGSRVVRREKSIVKKKKKEKKKMFQNVSHNRVNICIYLCVTLN